MMTNDHVVLSPRDIVNSIPIFRIFLLKTFQNQQPSLITSVKHAELILFLPVMRFFVVGYENVDIKIADFGLAREIRSMPPYTEYISTVKTCCTTISMIRRLLNFNIRDGTVHPKFFCDPPITRHLSIFGPSARSWRNSTPATPCSRARTRPSNLLT